MLSVAAVSGSWTVQGASPHSKSPLTTPAVAVGVQVAVGVGAGPLQVGPHLQAEMYLAGAVPQAAVALVGKLVAVTPLAVMVAQKADATETAEGDGHGKRAR